MTTKACLVDWVVKGRVIPWMIFDTVEAAIEARKTSHSSWPQAVCEFDESKFVETLSRKGQFAQRDSAYFGDMTNAYEIVSGPTAYYNHPAYNHPAA
jgi:hypothetical protein